MAFTGLLFFEPEGLTYPAGHGIIILSTTDKIEVNIEGIEISINGVKYTISKKPV